MDKQDSTTGPKSKLEPMCYSLSMNNRNRILPFALALAAPLHAAELAELAIPPAPPDSVAVFGTNEPLERVEVAFEMLSAGDRTLISNLDTSDGFSLVFDDSAGELVLSFHTTAGLETFEATIGSGKHSTVVKQIGTLCPSAPCPKRVKWTVNGSDQMIGAHADPLFDSDVDLRVAAGGTADLTVGVITE